jgi:hypothetical protein
MVGSEIVYLNEERNECQLDNCESVIYESNITVLRFLCQVLKVVELLKSGNDKLNGWEGIGVITPYSAQVRYFDFSPHF